MHNNMTLTCYENTRKLENIKNQICVNSAAKKAENKYKYE